MRDGGTKRGYLELEKSSLVRVDSDSSQRQSDRSG